MASISNSQWCLKNVFTMIHLQYVARLKKLGPTYSSHFISQIDHNVCVHNFKQLIYHLCTITFVFSRQLLPCVESRCDQLLSQSSLCNNVDISKQKADTPQGCILRKLWLIGCSVHPEPDAWESRRPHLASGWSQIK